MSLVLRELATKTSWPHSSKSRLTQGEWVPVSMAMRIGGSSEAKRRLRASGVVASLPSSIKGENWVFTEFVGQGTHTGPLVGPAGTIPPTGRRIGFPVGELMRIEEGKFTLVHVYDDGATLLRQLGVFPPRPEVLARILIYQAKKLRSRVRQRR